MTLPDREHIHLDEAQPGTVYSGSVTSFRSVEVVGPDTVRYVYPDTVVDFQEEQINRIPNILPASLGVRLGLRPFPGFVLRRSDLLWTADANAVLDPSLLLRTDEGVLDNVSDSQLALAYDLAQIAQTDDKVAYLNWFQRVAEQLDAKVPQGAVVEGFVKAVTLGGLGMAIKSRDKAPLVAVMQGLLGATIGNTLGSVVSHRMASHGSVAFTPRTTKVLRLANALAAGSKPDSFAAMHRVHHRYADTPNDPHSPLYQGRWKIFFGIKGISQDFIANHPELLAREQGDPNTQHLPFENPVTLTLGVAGIHWLLGEVLKQPIKHRAYAAAVHAAGLYMIRGAFTGDSHPDGAPSDFNFGPVTSIVMGGETDHARHHSEPYNPNHATVDPGYGLIWLLQKAGLAEIPAQDLISGSSESSRKGI